LKPQAPGLILGVGAKDGKIEKMATDIKKDYIKDLEMFNYDFETNC